MIENPKYKSAFLTILFYAIFWLLIIIRYNIFSSGATIMFFETIAPVALPAVTIVLLLKNIWQYFKRAKTNIFSIVIHGIIFLMYIFLLTKFLG
jgi:hypothetical protein